MSARCLRLVTKPVACTFTIDHQQVAGGKFLNVAKESLRRRRRKETQIVIQRLFIYFGRDGRMFQDGLISEAKMNRPSC